MKVRIKPSREEDRIQAKVGTGYIKITKFWRPVSLNQFVELFETNKEVLEFNAPEMEVANKIKNIEEKEVQKTEVQETEVLKESIEPSIEEPVNKIPVLSREMQIKLTSSSKDEIELYARNEFGIELDKRKSSFNMIKDLKRELKRL